jgi:hypothetical protein
MKIFRYRIVKEGIRYKIQRKCFWWRWVTYDSTKAWCQWFGSNNPYLFSTIEKAEEVIIKLKIPYDKNLALLNIHSDNIEIREATKRKLLKLDKTEINVVKYL